MPRANRCFLPEHVWLITNRCHKREFLLKVTRDALILSEGSAELKSYTNAAQAAILMAVVPVFARVYHRLGHNGGKHLMISRIMLFFIGNVFLFAIAYQLGVGVAVGPATSPA